MENKVVLITQARIGSTRLPSKVMRKISGKTLLEIQLSRIKNCKMIDKIVVAIPFGDEQQPLQKVCQKLKINFFQGSETNVLDRYYFAAKYYNCEWVVRITSDCPLIDSNLIDDIVSKVISANKDYGSNTLVETFPDGQDIEVFKLSALEDARNRIFLNSDKEHVTPFLKRNCETNGGLLYSSICIKSAIDFSLIRMTVDEKSDFDAIKLLVNELGFNLSWIDYSQYIINNLTKFSNQKIQRNQGYFLSIKND